MEEVEADSLSLATVAERTSDDEVENALEGLRNRALHANGTEVLLNDDLQKLIHDASRVHADYLFHLEFRHVLQQLLRAMAETSNVSYGEHWKTFGDKLGLSVNLLRVIENNHFNNEDPVYNTLLGYVQDDHATIGKIIKTLFAIDRLDVVTRTKDGLKELVRAVLETEHNMLQSGELSTMSCDVLLRPLQRPYAPLIMKNLTGPKKCAICSKNISQAFANNPNQPSSMNSNIEGRRSPYSKKVMLTFADDAADIGLEIARILRQPRGTDRIGVLILEEHLASFQENPFSFICCCLQMMDYVIPILTKGYLQSLLRRTEALRASSVDARYVPFIYQTLTQDYSRRGCRNTKVRCLIPDDQVESLLDHLMMACPIFSAWELRSRVEVLAKRILSPQT